MTRRDHTLHDFRRRKHPEKLEVDSWYPRTGSGPGYDFAVARGDELVLKLDCEDGHTALRVCGSP